MSSWHQTLQWSVAKHPENRGLHLRFRPNQGQQIHHFVNAFASNIRVHPTTGCLKLPEVYNLPQYSDIVLEDAVVRKITPTIHRLRSHKVWRGALEPSVYSRLHTCILSA